MSYGILSPEANSVQWIPGMWGGHVDTENGSSDLKWFEAPLPETLPILLEIILWGMGT